MTLSASMRVGQRPLRLICVFFPGTCSTRGDHGPFVGQPSNLGLLILDRAARAPEPPYMVGIWSRASLFRNVHPVHNSSQFGGIGAVSFASVARMTCLMSSLTGVFGQNLIPLLCDGVGKALGWHSVVPCPAFQQIPLNLVSMGSARGWFELEG